MTCQAAYEHLMMKAFSDGALSVEYRQTDPSNPTEDAGILVLYANIGAVRTRVSSISIEQDRNGLAHAFASPQVNMVSHD